MYQVLFEAPEKEQRAKHSHSVHGDFTLGGVGKQLYDMC